MEDIVHDNHVSKEQSEPELQKQDRGLLVEDEHGKMNRDAASADVESSLPSAAAAASAVAHPLHLLDALCLLVGQQQQQQQQDDQGEENTKDAAYEYDIDTLLRGADFILGGGNPVGNHHHYKNNSNNNSNKSNNGILEGALSLIEDYYQCLDGTMATSPNIRYLVTAKNTNHGTAATSTAHSTNHHSISRSVFIVRGSDSGAKRTSSSYYYCQPDIQFCSCRSFFERSKSSGILLCKHLVALKLLPFFRQCFMLSTNNNSTHNNNNDDDDVKQRASTHMGGNHKLNTIPNNTDAKETEGAAKTNKGNATTQNPCRHARDCIPSQVVSEQDFCTILMAQVFSD